MGGGGVGKAVSVIKASVIKASDVEGVLRWQLSCRYGWTIRVHQLEMGGLRVMAWSLYLRDAPVWTYDISPGARDGVEWERVFIAALASAADAFSKTFLEVIAG